MANVFWLLLNLGGLALNLCLGTSLSYFCAGANLILALHYVERIVTGKND